MLNVKQLKIEYMKNPIGIDVCNPRFSYTLEGDSHFQSAYRIVCAYDKAFGNPVYDTGKVESQVMNAIYYQGDKRLSRKRIYVHAKVWDENDIEGDWSEPAFFEMGLLSPEDWQAKWIAGDYTPKKHMRYPVDYFKKIFRIKKEVEKARLYITACGLYEASLNGRRVGNFVLAPGCTDYRKRLQYQTYDITDMLEEKNSFEVQLADGWYRGSIGCFGPTNVFGRTTKLCCQLEIIYADGKKDRISSDSTWRWSNDGALRFADLKDGEIYDASLSPSYAGHPREVTEKMVPTASNNVPVCMKERFTAKLIETPCGKRVLDFSQNIAGFVEFTVKGKKGQKIKLRFGEILDENGELTQSNFQVQKPTKEFDKSTEIKLIIGNSTEVEGEMQPTPKQEVEFICSGSTDTYRMSFAVFGFRYAEIETDVVFEAADFTAIAVYSNLEQTGGFHCSNEDVNQFVQNTLWSMKGNFLEIPSDCPTRERLGWTGDAQVFFNTAAYFMNVAPFFRKWMEDIRDAQMENGVCPAVVPYAGMDMMYNKTGESVGWADAVVLIPYRYWKRYGDVRILEAYYQAMHKYARFMIENCGHQEKADADKNPYNKYTYEQGMHLGEWLEPTEFRDQEYGVGIPHPEEGTAYLCYTMTHMAEIAGVLGIKEDEKLFSEYAGGSKKAYEWLFLKDGAPNTDRQAKLVRPLALGLCDGSVKEEVEERLVKAVERWGHRVGTGFLSTPFILPVLTAAGRVEVAYKMLENEKSPSWLSEVKAGATTVWESWEGRESQNHYSPGAVCQWLFDTVSGIRVELNNRITITPHPGGTLKHAKAYYESIYGMIRSEWKLEGDTVILSVKIPCNTIAEIVMPNGETHTVKSGDYIFSG